MLKNEIKTVSKTLRFDRSDNCALPALSIVYHLLCSLSLTIVTLVNSVMFRWCCLLAIATVSMLQQFDCSDCCCLAMNFHRSVTLTTSHRQFCFRFRSSSFARANWTVESLEDCSPALYTAEFYCGRQMHRIASASPSQSLSYRCKGQIWVDVNVLIK